MHPALVHEADLKEAFNCHRRGRLEKLLRSQGIRVLYGSKGEILTTVEAINAAMGLDSANEDDEVELE